MLKKSLIITLVIAAGLSPFLPKAFADDAAWKPILADRAWDYQSYNIQRLTVNGNSSGPAKTAGVTFLTNPSSDCFDSVTCNHVDLTILAGGKQETVQNVDAKFLNPTFEVGQNGRFVYSTTSKDVTKWFTAFSYDPISKETQTLTTLDRKSNELSLLNFVTRPDRLFASVMQTDPKTNQTGTSLIAKNIGGDAYEGRNISAGLSAPAQLITDAQNDTLLVKFTFATGNKQLWLINARTQKVSAIPNTWTDPQADILYAHFLPDGTAVWFQNYILYTFNPSLDTVPQSHGDAKLSWLVMPEKAIQVVSGRMAFIDSTNMLYTVDQNGVTQIGAAKNGEFHLGATSIYYQDTTGYREYSFDAKTYGTRSFHVTDNLNDAIVGTDANNNVWYQNSASGALLNIGTGTNPVLSDETHAYWKGLDGTIYQATFSTSLDVPKPTVQAFRSNSNPTVYLVSNNKIWRVANAQTYFSWFDSFDKVTRVNDVTLAAYMNTNTFSGDAPFAPGTRVKAIGDSRVYMMGSDGTLHWIVSETVASSIYGSQWNKGIIEVNPTDLWQFSHGINVESDQSIKSI